MARMLACRRQRASARYLDGDPIETLCREMGCSKSWLYKWKNRYQPDDPSWHQARSRRPARQTTQTSALVEQAIRETRLRLEQRGLPAGAAAIQVVLRQQGLEPVPSASTIYRILRRARLDHSLNR